MSEPSSGRRRDSKDSKDKDPKESSKRTSSKSIQISLEVPSSSSKRRDSKASLDSQTGELKAREKLGEKGRSSSRASKKEDGEKTPRTKSHKDDDKKDKKDKKDKRSSKKEEEKLPRSKSHRDDKKEDKEDGKKVESSELEKLKKEAEDSKKEANSVKMELAKYKAEAEDKAKEASKYKKEAEEHSKLLEEEKSSKADFKRQVEELQKTNASLETQLKTATEEKEALVKRITEQEVALKAESAALVDASATTLNQSSESVSGGLDKSSKTIQKYELQVEQNREKIEALKTQLAKAIEKTVEEQEVSKQKSTEIQALQEEITARMATEEKLRKDIVNLNDTINGLNHDLEKSAERVAKLETQNKQLSDDDEKTKKIEQLEASLAKMWATEPKEEGDLGEKLASDFEWWGQVIDKKFKSLAIEAPPEQDGKEEEKHFAHASANENAWELNMGPVQYSVASPYVSAAIWSMFYEFLNVDGKVSTGLKYAIAGASASSALQNCPHQVEKMGISAGINGFQDYDATIERAKNVSTAVTGDDQVLRWAYLLDSGKGKIGSAPFSPAEAPEVIGTSLLMVVACRVITVAARIGQSSSLPWFMSKSLASWVGKTYFTPQLQGVVLSPKASFDLTRAPQSPLPAKYAWCANEVLSETLERFREALNSAGEKALDQKIRDFVSDTLEAWDGTSGTGVQFVTEGMKKWKPTPEEKETFKARFALMVIFAPNEIPEKDWTRLVGLIQERNAINLVAWAGYKLMERLAEFLVGVKFDK